MLKLVGRGGRTKTAKVWRAPYVKGPPVGGVALAWLRLFLQGDETARSQLAIRPDIASGFESSGVAVPLAMEDR